jgi:hypothetical protein
MTRHAVNIVGYIDDDRSSDTVQQMLDRAAIKECFPPLTVVEIFVKEMTTTDRIDPKKVKRVKLSRA